MFKNEIFNELLEIVSEKTKYTNIELNIDNKEFKLNVDNNKYITVNNSGILYEIKDDKTHMNKSVIRVTPSNMQFYNKEYLENGKDYTSFGIKVDKDFNYMKISKNISTDNLYKTDIETITEDNKSIIKTKNRTYNKDGLLIYDNIQEEDLYVDVDEYNKLQLINSIDVYNLCNSIETIIPGISNYIERYNEDYSLIKKTNNKVLIKY